MSGSKSQWGARSGTGGGRTGWLDVSPSRRCPRCGHDSWCQIGTGENDGVTLCKRDESGTTRENRAGVTFYVHREAGAGQGVVRRRFASASPAAAQPDVLNRAYTTALAAMPLRADHREALRRRGLRDHLIDAAQYGSLELRGRAAVARAVIEAVGETYAMAVPGLYLRTYDDGGTGPSFAGAVGLVIPVRDALGRIVALKVRADDSTSQRYTFVSSARHGGAAALARVHHPALALAMRGTETVVALTEGPLKADVATALLQSPVLAIPGASEWRAGVEAAIAWGPRRVAVAMDMDRNTNVEVARAQREMIDALRIAGATVDSWRWDPRHKGLDDLLLARQVTSQGEADQTT